MGWLDHAVRRGVKKGVRDFLSSGEFQKSLDGIVREILRKPQFKFFWFVKEMQWEMMRVDPGLSGKRAWELAAQTYREHLRDEKIQFGDERYDWTKAGAVELIHAYEIDYWESAS